MRKELQDKLYKDFPKLFGGRTKSMQETCMCWGCECSDGWFGILYEMCEKIDKLGHDELRFVQVKEKLGGLRVYTNYYFEDVETIISEAEDKSYKTCEVCGTTETARTRGSGWVTTLCDECDRKEK